MSYDYDNSFPRPLQYLEDSLSHPLRVFLEASTPDLPKFSGDTWEALDHWYLTEVPRYYRLLLALWIPQRFEYSPRADKRLRLSQVQQGCPIRLSTHLVLGYLRTQESFRMSQAGRVNLRRQDA